MSKTKKERTEKLNADDFDVTEEGLVKVKDQEVAAKLRDMIKEAKAEPKAENVTGVRVDA